MKNISKGPTFGDFYPHREVDAGQHGCKTSEYKSTASPVSLLLNVMYCVRVSLRTVKIFLAQHFKEKGVVAVGNLFISLSLTMT
jgi:hypothetical protein